MRTRLLISRHPSVSRRTYSQFHKMHLTLYVTTLVAPIASLAAPANTLSNTKDLIERQTALVKPPPCLRNNSTTPRQTKKRSKAFARAFIYTQNITEAFTYIVSDYVVRLSDSSDSGKRSLHREQNHNPLAQNGSDSAWSILSPIWASQNTTPLRNTFQGTHSWLEYDNAAFGRVVDRFRWEGGCIVEHVSGAVDPSEAMTGTDDYSGIKTRYSQVKGRHEAYERTASAQS
jgi:hypothetical protein